MREVRVFRLQRLHQLGVAAPQGRRAWREKFRKMLVKQLDVKSGRYLSRLVTSLGPRSRGRHGAGGEYEIPQVCARDE